VFGRPGHTEATVDLLKLAGLIPVGVIAEMVSENGEMMRLPELLTVGEKEKLPVISIEQIFDYRELAEVIPRDDTVERIRFEAEAMMPSTHGSFKLRGYYDTRTTADHVAIIAGNPTGENVLVRMHPRPHCNRPSRWSCDLPSRSRRPRYWATQQAQGLRSTR
jgi:3,4-dihydroxy 2-butanone 4-phosphate synthase/GTP cyclohydrolase II